MSTLQQLRDAVRLQGDLDEEDLPDDQLDAFLREGFDRTMSSRMRWPFLEASWVLTKADGSTTIPVPSTPRIGFIERMLDESGHVMYHISQQMAEDNFGTQSAPGDPEFFSTWGEVLSLWPAPAPEGERTYRLRGYRQPIWTGVPADQIDGDERLHPAIMHYAIALSYAKLEDPELEDVYMRRWAGIVADVARLIMQPQFHVPLILNGGFPSMRRGRVRLTP